MTTGQAVDSQFVVTQARRALAQQSMELSPIRFQTITEQNLDIGVLVSLIPTGPAAPTGGGGLVWVDVQNGCAIVLRPYE
jgi:hypothetical protein